MIFHGIQLRLASHAALLCRMEQGGILIGHKLTKLICENSLCTRHMTYNPAKYG